MVGSLAVVTVLFGIFSVKLVSIPLFQAFRRCSILATVTVQYLMENKKPNQALVIATAVMVFGALLAGYENFNSELLGYLLIWGNNFA